MWSWLENARHPQTSLLVMVPSGGPETTALRDGEERGSQIPILIGGPKPVAEFLYGQRDLKRLLRVQNPRTGPSQIFLLSLYLIAWTGEWPRADKGTFLGSHSRLGMGESGG